MKVLVIEDYAPLAKSIAQGLREAGYTVESAGDGTEGLQLAETMNPDCIVLDIMLPGVDGLTVLSTLRSKNAQTAVVLLTARDSVGDRVKGLDLGADDYLVKPFAFEELLARVRVVIRRRYQSSANTIQVGDLELDTVGRVVKRSGTSIALSAKEYALLEYLISRRGQVVTRAEIWDHVYDFAAEPSSNVVDVYIGYLRKKIDLGHDQKLIHTRRGLGYLVGAEA
jgi:DNA-binding response OmpR family regulator